VKREADDLPTVIIQRRDPFPDTGVAPLVGEKGDALWLWVGRGDADLYRIRRRTTSGNPL